VPAESYLRRVLKDHCGPDIIETFNSKNFRRIFGKESETIIYHTGLSILDKATTQRIHDKLALRDKVNRKGGRKNKYLLTGFIRCQKCNYPVNGHTTDAGHSTYRHIQKRPAVNKEYPHCFGGGIKTQDLDNAVMSTIFENIMDVKGFEKAIAESLPDSKDMKALQHRIKRDESKLLNVKKQLSRLVDMALAGTLSDKTIKEKEAEILQAKEALEKSVIEDRTALQSMESSKGLEEQAEAVRRNLKQYFGSKDRLNEMSFDEKRELLSFLFTGKDQSGTNYAIYIEPNPDGSWDYFLYGRLIVGLRTVKGDDIDYDPESGQNNNPGNKVIKLDIFKKSASQLAAG